MVSQKPENAFVWWRQHHRTRDLGPRRVGSSRGKTAPPACAVAVRVDLASVNAGVMNSDGLGQFVTFGRQSGSTRSEACGAVLPDLCHASSTRRCPRSLARWGVVVRPPCIEWTWTAVWRVAGVVPGASRRVSTPTSAKREGARSDGFASTRVRRSTREARLPGVRAPEAGGRCHGCG